MVSTQPYGLMECDPGCSQTPACAYNNQVRGPPVKSRLTGRLTARFDRPFHRRRGALGGSAAVASLRVCIAPQPAPAPNPAVPAPLPAPRRRAA
jgi:hypothetical protein